MKADIETRTDTLAASAYTILDPDEREELVQALRPLTRTVIAAGEIPRITPIGFDLQAADGDD
ncbi:helix-turn-helix domain-containing protein [Nocardia brevicatena]|uniref:helix-turn-helix domain-containing protein n=1 Tax=Nocardia brevicatena TaxID=37327 RepID=UPI003F685108